MPKERLIVLALAGGITGSTLVYILSKPGVFESLTTDQATLAA